MQNHRHLQSIARLALLFLSVVVIAPHLVGRDQKAENNPITNELAVAEGKIISYSFLDDSRGVHQYTIRLSGYPATFQIPSDFVKYFARDRFDSNLKKGDTLAVSILAQNAGNLTSTGPIPIFAARTETATYLDEHYTLGGHDDELNDNAVKANRSQTNDGNANSKHAPALMSIVYPLIDVALIILVIGVALALLKPKSRPATVVSPDAAFIDESSQRLKRLATKGKFEQKPSEPAGQKPDEPPPAASDTPEQKDFPVPGIKHLDTTSVVNRGQTPALPKV